VKNRGCYQHCTAGLPITCLIAISVQRPVSDPKRCGTNGINRPADAEIDKLLAIFRWLSKQPCLSLKISFNLRIEIGVIGIVILTIKNEKNNG
jgi:hypothetical protein